jgi:hypothetical protein
MTEEVFFMVVDVKRKETKGGDSETWRPAAWCRETGKPEGHKS